MAVPNIRAAQQVPFAAVRTRAPPAADVTGVRPPPGQRPAQEGDHGPDEEQPNAAGEPVEQVPPFPMDIAVERLVRAGRAPRIPAAWRDCPTCARRGGRGGHPALALGRKEPFHADAAIIRIGIG